MSTVDVGTTAQHCQDCKAIGQFPPCSIRRCSVLRQRVCEGAKFIREAEVRHRFDDAFLFGETVWRR